MSDFDNAFAGADESAGALMGETVVVNGHEVAGIWNPAGMAAEVRPGQVRRGLRGTLYLTTAVALACQAAEESRIEIGGKRGRAAMVTPWGGAGVEIAVEPPAGADFDVRA